MEGQAEFYPLPLGVLNGFIVGRLEGEDSFHPRGFPLSLPWSSKGMLPNKNPMSKARTKRSVGTNYLEVDYNSRISFAVGSGKWDWVVGGMMLEQSSTA